MCRFALYLGPSITISQLVTDPDHSIVKQSYMSRERTEPLNGDGFGIAWYCEQHSLEPAVFRSVFPAWSNANLGHLARVTASDCILAHVRAATPGLPVTELNCHPFTWMHFAFMHNGDVGGFRRIKRKLLEGLSNQAFDMIQGSTDSEHLFAWFTDRFNEQKARATEDASPLNLMRLALTATIRDVERMRASAGVTEPAFLNLAVTDGSRAVITRYITGGGREANTLYYSQGRAYTCVDGVCRMLEKGTETQAVLVASEPLSQDAVWIAVDPNHVVSVDDNQHVTVSAMDIVQP